MGLIKQCGFILLLVLNSLAYFTEALVYMPHQQKTAEPPSASESNGVHIVYMGGISTVTTNALADVHVDMLSQVLGSAQAARESILYSYTNSFNGFAAVFSESHAKSLSEMESVVSVFPSKINKVHTTYSWEYLGLSTIGGLWPQSNFGADVIIGMIDTGVWPESESFRDDGFGPIPSKWNGTCVTGDQFGPQNCNKKLIGARFFFRGYEAEFGPIQRPEYKSPRDADGHGSHTTSTAAGRQVPDASLYGVANGTASGGGSSARVAAYKACYVSGCADADILAAFDYAIADGVDIISASLGEPTTGYLNSISLGAFHAIDKGILVSCSAGNNGPLPFSVLNVAPWILTVGASTIDRTFVATVELGNGKSIQGLTINPYKMNSSYPLVFGGDIAVSANVSGDSCQSGSLDPVKARGKIIVCIDALRADEVVLGYGGAGVIIVGPDDLSLFQYVLPAATVNDDQGTEILEYINSTRSPRAIIGESKTTFNSSAPILMADFSSTGPNLITPQISKPDITAPGVSIIAAWSPVDPPSEEVGIDNRTVNFNIISGTSMSCPHVTGAAALVKSVHPDWSAASIKSALMTTATPLKPSLNELGFDGNSGLAAGSGQINPTRAADPGLVFNITTMDYVLFLCTVGFSSIEIQLISGQLQTCPANPPTVLDLNYPSIYVTYLSTFNLSTFLDTSNLSSTLSGNRSSSTQTVKRTLTNVGQPAQYHVRVVPPTTVFNISNPNDVQLRVTPSTLSFTAVNEELSFTVAIEVLSDFQDFAYGSIIWSDGTHSVRVSVGVGPSAFGL